MSLSSDKVMRPSEALSSNQLLEMYYFARLARDVEERLVILFRQSKVIGGLYRSLGQEGESVATAYALDRSDAVLPLIRNMGALMTVGVRPLEADGILAEVLDLRSLAPLDRDAILASVGKTSRVLLLYEARRTGGIGGELAAIIAEEAFEYLDAPIVRIASVDAPVPYAPPLEAAFLPSVEKVVGGAKKLVEY